MYAEMTLGVITLLVGSLMHRGSTSRGSSDTVRTRRRLINSGNGVFNMTEGWVQNQQRTSESIRCWHYRPDGS